MAEKYIDSNLLDRAIIFATKAHANTERRGKGFPYIVHPLEALSIVSTMSNDQTLLAAAVLHDVAEDTPIKIEDIEKEFGAEVASIVKSETSYDVDLDGNAVSWKDKKQATLNHLKNASKEAKMVALGDKLSNIRAIKQDYLEIGNKIWDRFHDKDPKNHAWYYLSLVDALSELKEYYAFKEFEQNVHDVFDRYIEFKITKTDSEILLEGYVSKEDSFEIEKVLDKGKENIINCDKLSGLSFGAMRTLIRLHQNGYRMFLRLVSPNIASKLEDNGISSLIPLVKKYGHGSLDGMYISGDGYTSTTYFDEKDEDIMIKLFSNKIPVNMIEKEKIMAKEALLTGVNTPISGEICYFGDRVGFSFERVVNKISFSRAVANEPEKIPEIAKRFALMTREFHKITPLPGIFPDQSEIELGFVNILAPKLDKDIVEKLKALILEYKDAKTLIHGDFHTGNAVMTDKGDNIMIDLADLAIGSPYYDIGSMYLFAHAVSDERCMQIFHFDRATMKKFYDAFFPVYFEGKDLEKEWKICKKFAAFRLIYHARFKRFEIDSEIYNKVLGQLLDDTCDDVLVTD